MSPLFSSGRDKWRRWEFVHPPQQAGGLGTGRERRRRGLQSERRTSPDATGPQSPIDGSALAPGAQMRPNSQKGPAGETLRSPGRLEPWGQQSAHQPGRWGQKWMPCPWGAWHHLPRVFGSLTLPWTTCHEGKQARWGCGRCPVILKALSSCRQSPPPSRPCMLGARETSPTQALQRSRLVPVLLSYELHLTMSALGPSTQVEAGCRETQVMVVHSARFMTGCVAPAPGKWQ